MLLVRGDSGGLAHRVDDSADKVSIYASFLRASFARPGGARRERISGVVLSFATIAAVVCELFFWGKVQHGKQRSTNFRLIELLPEASPSLNRFDSLVFSPQASGPAGEGARPQDRSRSALTCRGEGPRQAALSHPLIGDGFSAQHPREWEGCRRGACGGVVRGVPGGGGVQVRVLGVHTSIFCLATNVRGLCPRDEQRKRMSASWCPCSN